MSWKKSFATASLRRQCLLLRLARYEFKWRTTVGRTHALSWVNPLSPKPMDSNQMDVIHLTSTVQATDNRLEQEQSGHFCWFSSKPVTTLNLSRLATSETATPKTSVILGTVITGRSFFFCWTWCVVQSPSTCDSNLTESRVSKRSSNGLLSRGKNSVESTRDSLLVRDLGLCKKCS